MKQVEIYTDGACSNNPGPGGWGAVLIYGKVTKELSGFAEHTTNQQMELQAAISALEALKAPCSVKLHSDSAYLVNAFKQKWLDTWQANGWSNAKKQPVSNQKLWERLVQLERIHSITWIKVKGHSDNHWNNRCDQLARKEITSRSYREESP